MASTKALTPNGAQHMTFHHRLGCSTISFRRLALPDALSVIGDLGFTEIDLGALPGVCDHVPFVLDKTAVGDIAAAVRRSGLGVRSVNGDIGDLNLPLDSVQQQQRADHLDRLLELCSAIGAEALVLPCGALSHDPVTDLPADLDLVAGQLVAASERAKAYGVQIWVESLHFFRLSWNLERAAQLADLLAGSDVGIVLDVSHVVASGGDSRAFVERFRDRIRHVHLRDAVLGDIHRSIGKGTADFADCFDALKSANYTGQFSLELETNDVANDERPAAAARAADLMTALLHQADRQDTSMTKVQRTAVITGVGAARGIGRATAHRLAADGWAVAALDLDGVAAEKLATEITERYGVPAYGGVVDVADEGSVQAARDAVLGAGLPVIGAVVNIAGITSPLPFRETTLELWNKVMAVNVTGTYLVTKTFLDPMVNAGYGRILTMSSVSAQQGGGVFGKTPYSTAKAAILGLTRSLARELGPHGITVNAVAPGAVDTDIRAGVTTPELEAAITATVPLGRQATVEDVAALFAFLASDDAAYITGATHNLNGGSYIA
jgi:2-hydroxycyclohexanecarboxyl-CoA dehydrogenase